MNKVLGSRFWVLVFCSILLVFTITYHLKPRTSFAQTSTPSGSLIQKLEELKKEIASKAAEIKNDINKKVQNKAVLGKILKIEDSKMLIQGLTSVKTVNFDEFTEVIGLNNKKIKIGTLDLDDNVAALGDFDDKNTLAAKRIIYQESPATISGELIWGQMQKTQGQSITIKDKSGQSHTVITNSQTAFALGNNEASIADAKPEKYMIAKGIRLKDGTLRARFVYFIPSVGFVKPSTKSSTQSGIPKE